MNEMSNRTAAEIQKDIDALKAEIVEIKEKSNKLVDKKVQIARQEKELQNRLAQINGGYFSRFRSDGLIDKLNIELKESGFPRYDETRRVVSVTSKTIGLKVDGMSFESVTRYSMDTGWRQRARSDWDEIDAKKALEIWDNYKAAIK